MSYLTKLTFVSILIIKPEALGEKRVLAPFLLTQIPYEPAWDEIQVSTVKGLLLMA